MKRPNVNFIVDCLGFAAFVLLTATGVLMRYVLPPGSGRSTTIWSLDRHEWGDIHFWIAIAFFAALALHLFLHWRWIVTLMSGRPREGSGARVALGTLGLAACLALAVSPFLSPVERAGGEHGTPHPHSYELEDLESIRGCMTLSEIEEATGVPAAHLSEELGLPAGVETNQNLGKLRRTYEFSMDDVRRIVHAYQQGETQRPRQQRPRRD
jgi:hypothetical protein